MNAQRIRVLPIVAVLLCLLSSSFSCADDGRKPAPQLHAAVTPAYRKGDWWAKRHEAMNERVKKGNVDMVFIGDSITQGWEGAGKKVWDKFYGNRNAVNLGIGGDRTEHVLWRMDHGNLKDISPKLAVVMIGTNNAGSNSSREIAEGVTAIVNQLREKKPEMKILLLGIFPRGANNDDRFRKVNEGVNKIISVLHDGEMVHYLDFGKKFLQKDGTLPKSVMPDLLHLNQASYTIWAEAIEPSVEQLLSDEVDFEEDRPWRFFRRRR